MTIRELRELIADMDDNMRVVVESEDVESLVNGFESYSNGEEVFVLATE